jgi:hypothetical protein
LSLKRIKERKCIIKHGIRKINQIIKTLKLLYCVAITVLTEECKLKFIGIDMMKDVNGREKNPICSPMIFCSKLVTGFP